MSRNRLDELWDELIPGNHDVFRLVNAHYPVAFYAGVNASNQRMLAILSDKKPPAFPHSKSIEVWSGKRDDGRWMVKMVLCDNELRQLFLELCNDLMRSSLKADTAGEAVKHVYDRFSKWILLLSRGSTGLLATHELRGLIGELLFLKEMCDLHQPDTAVEAWIGPAGVDQDFRFSDSWYEVKTVHVGAHKVQISSVEQLDVYNYPGELILVYLDSATPNEPNSFTIITLLEEIRAIIGDYPNASTLLEDKLLDAKYTYHPEYGEIRFSLDSIIHYTVTGEFPRFKRTEIPAGIGHVSYELSIPALTKFLV